MPAFNPIATADACCEKLPALVPIATALFD